MLSVFKSTTQIQVFKCHKDATTPTYSTEGSACFDIHACLVPGTTARAKVKPNPLSLDTDANLVVQAEQQITIPPGARVLVPTGLKLSIPKNHSVRLHPRSGLSFNHGITLCNCEGVIDEDYVDEVLISIQNTSNKPYVVRHGDRVCQGELVKDNKVEFAEIKTPPTKKTSRFGGFGSTGA